MNRTQALELVSFSDHTPELQKAWQVYMALAFAHERDDLLAPRMAASQQEPGSDHFIAQLEELRQKYVALGLQGI